MNIGRFEEELLIEPVDQLHATDAYADEVPGESPTPAGRDGLAASSEAVRQP